MYLVPTNTILVLALKFEILITLLQSKSKFFSNIFPYQFDKISPYLTTTVYIYIFEFQHINSHKNNVKIVSKKSIPSIELKYGFMMYFLVYQRPKSAKPYSEHVLH